MTALWRDLPAYRQLAGIWPQMAYAYRFNLLFWLLTTVLQIFLLKVVWTAIYAERGAVEGVDLETLVAFLTLANLQLWLFYPILAEVISGRIREGKIALDLARPIPFLSQSFAQQVGATAALAPFLVLILPLAFVLGSLRPPASPTALGLYLVSLALAYSIQTSVGLMLGLLAFWMVENWAIVAIYNFVTQFFAGALVPLWLFPTTMRTIAELLPFQTQAHTPIGIYLGLLTGDAAFRGLALQLFWAIVLYLAARRVWSVAVRHVVIQGG